MAGGPPGAFDVTVQPLWQLRAAHFAGADANGPPETAVVAARRLVDHRAIRLEPTASLLLGSVRHGASVAPA
ncbi:MAG TPA: hypothetical protein VEB64_17255 [Azospirillaceae bacterium]|nr:hypothetical protein [Azospirillaceae bacterium]